MIRVRDREAELPAQDAAALVALQGRVTAKGSYDARVEDAKARWDSTKKDTAPFIAIKDRLTAMCWGARRCTYCEDSVADEIEHFRPKDLYPDVVFDWANYLYACGPCNGPKNNHFAVFAGNDDRVTDVTRAPKAPVLPPTDGAPALLDPRVDDPLEYLVLDLDDTFAFTARPRISARMKARAEYTIRCLRLNDRPYLIEARRTSHAALLVALEAARTRKREGRDLAPPRRAIQHTSHRSVWEEMKRRSTQQRELGQLFQDVPEALTW